eukprot:3685951-Rhodomonas_salina.10
MAKVWAEAAHSSSLYPLLFLCARFQRDDFDARESAPPRFLRGRKQSGEGVDVDQVRYWPTVHGGMRCPVLTFVDARVITWVLEVASHSVVLRVCYAVLGTTGAGYYATHLLCCV